MSDDKRLDNLSEEIKLLKGEIKNSLTSVRDYLLNMELPSSEFSTILAALSGDGGGQKISLDGNMGNKNEPKNENPIEEPEITADDLNQPPLDEPLIDMEPPESVLEDIPEDQGLIEEVEQPEEEPAQEETEPIEDEVEEPEDVVEEVEEVEEEEDKEPEEDEEGDEEEEADDKDEQETGELEPPEDEIDECPEAENEDSGLALDTAAEEEQPMELERTTADLNQGTPRVNMLANLINWVSRAKREIGDELLPTFLDVYGVSGHLSLELKEVILHLADRTKEKTEPCTDAEVWSQTMLSLHGILTGGDAPLNPAIPLWKEALDETEDTEDEIIEVDKQDRPVKLKLVLPGSNGKGREYCLDLTPGNNDDNE
jgi:hypothetical protein